MAGKRPTFTTKEYLESIPLPQHASSYTCISHKFIIDNVYNFFKINNLEIELELYKSTMDGEIATGIYYIKGKTDPELTMMFAWANSYDKSMRFKCSIGARVNLNQATIIGGDVASWGRVHKGSADVDTQNTIHSQIQDATRHFTNLINDKEAMKNIQLSTWERASLLGVMYAIKDLFTIEQFNIAVREMKKPSYEYPENEKHSLWTFYNNILVAIKSSHPKKWLDRQRSLHWFLCCHFNIGNYCSTAPGVKATSIAVKFIKTVAQPVLNEGLLSLDEEPVDSNQLNLLDAIAEAEKESGIQDPHVLIRNMDGEPLVISKFEDGVEEEEITLDEPKIGSDFDIDNTDDLTLDEQDNKVIEPVLESVPTVVPTIISEVPHSSKEESLELTAEQQAALDAFNDDDEDPFSL